ncbi:MAG TPA: pyrimidine dimer DNA glycosylase/endonuclease V [Actinomycetales bacterium]|nr:pyrimidine dimer DNA glycosylase/endonuclease V [Actinomycetales bacterium]
MRIWSLHPEQLDRQALVACWREGLLAQAVLAGRTTGYRQHPQLRRFLAQVDPLVSVVAYLEAVASEADRRGYHFDRGRLDPVDLAATSSIPVTEGQLAYEWQHLLAKVAGRNAHLLGGLRATTPRPHPLFHLVPGDVADWEVRR